ncbi:2-succinyl-5-enolpyruvyl-6-hydroxy-3-cyclohexene-1-carboxylic-acid synthase [Microbacterium sp. F2]|uniref:2-succinyl-5-enolpyruvyl-6-hydroxy-3- cyclohexene-1-carboxylic-acid synthase n=1 Tax=Microbacterium sp. F2 TaxID=3422228 RepID=UPI003FD29D11
MTTTSPADPAAPRDGHPVSDRAGSGSRSPATDAAAALLDQLISLGVRDVVLSPGSRSQALALAAADAEERGRVRLHVRIDERVAGFTALGIGRETRMPAAVVCTSGTAVANLAPAVLEAHHSAVPLLLLTADRPPELRGVGANQTTRQPGIFTPNTRFELDVPAPTETDDTGTGDQSAMLRDIADQAVAAAIGDSGRPAGPVHLNLPFREPLAGSLPPWWTADAGIGAELPDAPIDDDQSGALYQGGGGVGDAVDAVSVDESAHVLVRGVRTLVVAGEGAGSRAEALAWDGGWPLVAEIVSGARFGRHLVHAYRELLHRPELSEPIERVIVLGHPTLARETTALLTRDDVEVIALRGPGETVNLNGATLAVAEVAVAPAAESTTEALEVDRAWLGAWMRASRAASVDLSVPAPDGAALASTDPQTRLGAISAELAVLRERLDRVSLVDAVWRATWPHDRLVFGSSRLVRVADTVLPGKKVTVHANRGLAGIDGTVATGIGVAIASQADGAAGVTRVVLGDLALLHDVGSLLLAPGETAPRIQVIVGNDAGGTIFDGLEVAALGSKAQRDRVLYTPQDADLQALAAAYGWTYARIDTRAALDQALTAPVTGPQLIEVPLPR